MAHLSNMPSSRRTQVQFSMIWPLNLIHGRKMRIPLLAHRFFHDHVDLPIYTFLERTDGCQTPNSQLRLNRLARKIMEPVWDLSFCKRQGSVSEYRHSPPS